MIRWSVHLSMLFTDLPVLERPGAARDAGYSLVETWWPGADADAWVEAVRRAGVEVSLVNCDGGDLASGERGFLNIPELSDRELERIENAMALASRVGCSRVNVLVGRLDGRISERRQRATAVGVLREAARTAATCGIVLLVESLNDTDVPGYLLPTALDARRFIELVGSESVRLLYDAYHAARSGSDPIVEAPGYIDVISHVQYADHPGRGAPGTGRIDLHRFAERLCDGGYKGAIGLEFNPRGSTIAALASIPDILPIRPT